MKNSILDGEYVGIITSLKADKLDGLFAVRVTVAVWTGRKVEVHHKCYKRIFRNGRAAFQGFIRDFDLTTEDNGLERVDLSLALGCYCIAEFDVEQGFVSLTPVYDDDDIDLTREGKYLDKLRISQTVDSLPNVVKNYTCFPYNENGYQPEYGYFGFVVDYKVYRDRWNLDDETVRLKVAVVNGGHVREFDYYFNRIHSDGKHDFDVFCDIYDLADDFEQIIGIPFETRLYETYKGKNYVFTLDPYYTDQKKQIDWFMDSYYRYWQNPHPGYTFDEIS